MKKIIYFIMLALGIIGIGSLWFTSFYHFDADKSLNNNVEYIYLVDIAINEESEIFVDETSVYDFEKLNRTGYISSTDEEKENFKQLYEKQMSSIYALMNNDEEAYFTYNQYEVLNIVKNALISEYESLVSDTTDPDKLNVYNENLNNLKSLSNLEFTSSENDVKTREDLLKPYISILKIVNSETLSYDDRVLNAKANMMADRKNAIIKYLSSDGNEEVAKKVALEVTTGGVVDTLFLALAEETYGTDEYTNKVNKYAEKGVGVTLLVKTWETAINIYKAYFADEANQSKGKVAMFKEAFLVEYNIFPLLIISIVMLIFVFGNLKMIFGGLRGMNGRKYPKTFLSCAISLAVAAFLICATELVDKSFFLSYSYAPEMIKLKQMFLVGSFDGATLINALAFGAGLFISIIGRLCRWNKKKSKKYADR